MCAAKKKTMKPKLDSFPFLEKYMFNYVATLSVTSDLVTFSSFWLHHHPCSPSGGHQVTEWLSDQWSPWSSCSKPLERLPQQTTCYCLFFAVESCVYAYTYIYIYIQTITKYCIQCLYTYHIIYIYMFLFLGKYIYIYIELRTILRIWRYCM